MNTGDEKSVATNKQKTFTKFNTRPDAHDTFERTLAHSDHTPSAEYCTNNDVRDPGYARYVNPGVGAREKLLVQRAAALAKDEEDGTIGELPSNYQSTHRQDFGQLELPPAESLGRKVCSRQARRRRAPHCFLRRRPRPVHHRRSSTTVRPPPL